MNVRIVSVNTVTGAKNTMKLLKVLLFVLINFIKNADTKNTKKNMIVLATIMDNSPAIIHIVAK